MIRSAKTSGEFPNFHFLTSISIPFCASCASSFLIIFSLINKSAIAKHFNLTFTFFLYKQLLQIPEIQQTLTRARHVDLAIVGLGMANKSATLSQIGYLAEEDVRELEQANVMGDITSYFFDQCGQYPAPIFP